GRPHDVAQRFCNGIPAARCFVNKGCQWRMANGSGDPVLTLIVQSRNPAVVQRQLQGSCTLLFGNQASYAAVYLIGKPVLASYSFELEYLFEVGYNFRLVIREIFIVDLH